MGKALFVCMLMLVVFASVSVETGVKVTEAKLCQTTGHAASCLNDSTCNSKCEKQGFTNGKCDGIRRRCTCYKPC
ncbi:Gamma thionin [Artemisia annua]|uniref:Gamma thionin n=1 Tax=Artemisia annua TaxID=35608 RepID=A0A2U1KN40_ARTAN|nr:Gamma thionin [Artemisia annua]